VVIIGVSALLEPFFARERNAPAGGEFDGKK
jgi:hypothetical protein